MWQVSIPDCKSLLDYNRLRIIAIDTLDNIQFAAISYVWDGLKPLPKCKDPVICVRGIRDAHPINAEVLRTACQLSLQKSAYFL